MARIFYTITEGQAKKLRDHCKRLTEKISESPGFANRRIIHAVNLLLDTGISLDKFRDGCKLLVKLHKEGVCFRRACERIEKIKAAVKR